MALLAGTVQQFSEKTKFAVDVGAILREYDTGESDNDVIAP